MFGQEARALAAYKDFIVRVPNLGQVWGLQGKDGWCRAPAQTSDDIEGEHWAEVIPFWSHRVLADLAATGDWKGCVPTPIGLDEFLDVWLPRLAEERTLAGTDWNPHRIGRELYPGELLDALRESREAEALLQLDQSAS